MSDKKTNNKAYDAQSIKVLEGLEGVRKRPAMYIGSTGINGLHHLAYEIADNSVDEALAGHCDKIDVVLYADGSCSVEDNGRGVPVDKHKGEGISAAEVVMTKLHAGGKFSKDSYKYSGGLHGVGAAVVNGLSKHLEINIFRDGKEYFQKYQIGIPQGPLKVVGESDKRGTLVKFWPDASIFTELEFNFDVLAARFREISFLNRGLTIGISSHITSQEKSFYFEGGISSFVQHVGEKKSPLFPDVVSFTREDDTYVLDFAFQYNDSYGEQTYTYVNNIRTTEGGTHEAGMRAALTKACNKYAQSLNILKGDNLSSDDVREGLISVLSIKVPEPQFEGQTKTKLGNSEVKGIVDSWLYAFLDTFFEENPNIAKTILRKAVGAQQARLAAKKARELTRRKNVMESSVLPGKLADCSDTDPSKCELYIVEGDSAGGSAKQARSRFTQAILPLRGKIINVEKAIITRALGNEEIKDIITAVGAGVGSAEFDASKVRYHKIIIMTDADVDGSHIRILLLTFFFRYMAPLLEEGYLYIAQPPLYKAKMGRSEQYLKDETELKSFIFAWGKDHLAIEMPGEKFVQKEELSALLEDLLLYDNELEKVGNFLEIGKRDLHELTKVICEKDLFNKGLSAEVLAEKIDGSFSGATSFVVAEEAKDGHEERAPFVRVLRGKQSFDLPLNFFASGETEILLNYFVKVTPYDNDPLKLALLSGKGEPKDLMGVVELSARIVDFGKSALTLQRYKGLGEMNPDQLWETTMDPAVRTLLKVTVDDAIKADESFTALMGDQVAPRRAFIEKHAHFVRNLDV